MKSRSLKAKYVAKKSEIDESLFGKSVWRQEFAPISRRETRKS